MADTKTSIFGRLRLAIRAFMNTFISVRLYLGRGIFSNTDKEIVDDNINDEYIDDMEEIRKIGRAMSAKRYGVSPADVTDDFLRAKLDEHKKKFDEYIESYERDSGIKLTSDTPEHRREVEIAHRRFLAGGPSR